MVLSDRVENLDGCKRDWLRLCEADKETTRRELVKDPLQIVWVLLAAPLQMSKVVLESFRP